MKLIDEAKQAYKLYSVQAMAVATAIITTWASIPDDSKAFFPLWVTNTVHWATVVILVGGILGRLVDQQPAPKADPDATTPGAK